MADTNENIVKFALAVDKDIEVELDAGDFHEKTIARLLTTAAANYVRNNVNGAHQRWVKAGSKSADKPDYAKVAGDAKQRLIDGTLQAAAGEGKGRKTKDPVDAIVTQAVMRDVFAKMQAKNPKAKWTDAVKKVGGSGLEYLRKLAGDDADKVKNLNTRYVKPAQTMLGLNAKGEKIATTDTDDSDDLI